jgi:hypothetical protein
MRLIDKLVLKIKKWIAAEKARKKANEKIKTAAHLAYMEEKAKQAIETARFKAKQEAKIDRKDFKEGGTTAKVLKAVGNFADSITQAAPVSTSKSKKGKQKNQQDFDLNDIPMPNLL